MTTSTAVCRAYMRTQIALARDVIAGQAYVMPANTDDDDTAEHDHRPGDVCARMAGHLRLERWRWDASTHTARRREVEASALLSRIGFDAEDLDAHLTAAMRAARGRDEDRR